MRTIRLRAATPADRPAVTRLIHSVLEEYALVPDPDGVDADLAALPESYTADGGYFGVVVDGQGDIAGSIGLLPRKGGRIELRKMYFLPSLRGQGAGKALLDWALRRARADGYREVELETARALREALGLYRSFGFSDDASGPDTGRCDFRLVLDVRRYVPRTGLRAVIEESS